MIYKEFITKSKSDVQSAFRTYAPEENSEFQFSFASVPDENGDIVRHIIVQQTVDSSSVKYTNSNFFLSSKINPILTGWLFIFLAKNPELYKAIYFDEYGLDGKDKHNLLINELNNLYPSVGSQFMALREREYPDGDIDYFFQTLKKAIDGEYQALSENIDPKFLEFLTQEIASPPRYQIVNHQSFQMLTIGHFDTQYFKYMFNQINMSQFLDDNLIREVLLTSALSFSDANKDVRSKKKL